MTKLIKVIFIFLLLGTLLFFGFDLYKTFQQPNEKSPTGKYEITVKKGESLRDIANLLKENQVIASESALLWHNLFNPVDNLQTGVFTLSLPATPENIISQLQVQNSEKILVNSKANRSGTVNITLKEGESIDEMIEEFVAQGLFDKQTLVQYLQNPVNFDKIKFPFLPQPLKCTYGEMQTCAKYYIEGYLYPDTYSFFKNESIDSVFEKILNNFKVKVWNKVQNQVQNKNFHEIVIMASVVEKEVGRPITGINSTNIDEVNSERRKIASVFYNRLDISEKWRSNPTVVYGLGRQTCEQTMVINNCVYLDSPEANNKYNTYNNVGYPIGPITSPQFDTINDVINPEQTNYLYFVAEKSGKTYFAATDREHEINIAKVKQINNRK
jgi:UPF0755 protein